MSNITDYTKFFLEYEEKDTSRLLEIRSSLQGNIDCPSGKTSERIRAINGVLSARGHWVPDDQDITEEEQQHFFEDGSDEHVARKYVQTAENARRKGLEFTLTLVDMRRLVRRKTCFYTGISFEKFDPKGVSRQADMRRLSLDRIDNSKGYTRENTVACCKVVNYLKNELVESKSSPKYLGLKALVQMAFTMADVLE